MRDFCPDCGVRTGSPHTPGCDVERCSVCKRQRLSCGCAGHDPAKMVWDGEWPGVKECRDKGWFCVEDMEHGGFKPVSQGTEGAFEDLNRLAYFHTFGVDGLYKRQGRA